MESESDSSTAKEESYSRSKRVSVEESKEENVASGVKRKLQEALATDTDDAIAVVGDCDDFEFTMESLSAVEFAGYSVSLFWDESSLALRMRDNLSKRLFTAKYSHSQLVTDMKFPPLMSCEAICTMVAQSMDCKNKAVTCSSEQTTGNMIALIVKHEIIEGHCVEYCIQLTEVSQKETDVLLAIIGDLRDDISANEIASERIKELQSKICAMEKRQKKEEKRHAVHRSSFEAAIEELKDQMATVTEIVMETAARKMPRIASYRSNSMVDRFRKWDTVELAPTMDGMVTLSADLTEFRIGVKGVFRVLSAVCTQNCSNSYNSSLFVNGEAKCQAFASQRSSAPLCFVGRLRVGDKIKVYISNSEYNHGDYNWLQIEKL